MCLFCDIRDKKIPSTIVYENDYIYCINDIKPVAPVHVLIIPKKHFDDIIDMSSSEEGIKYIGESDERAATEKQHELDVKYGPTEPEGIHYWVDPENPILIDDEARLRSSPKTEPREDPAEPSNLYFEIPDVPFIKTSFTTRIYYSDILQESSFKNAS